jgi:hypothetical protein
MSIESKSYSDQAYTEEEKRWLLSRDFEYIEHHEINRRVRRLIEDLTAKEEEALDSATKQNLKLLREKYKEGIEIYAKVEALRKRSLKDQK